MVMGTEAHDLLGISRGFKYDLPLLSDQNSISVLEGLNLDVEQPLVDPNAAYGIGIPDLFPEAINSLKLDVHDTFLDSISLMDFPGIPCELEQKGYAQTTSSNSNLSSTTSPSSNPSSSTSPSSDHPCSGSGLSASNSPDGDHHEDPEIYSDIVLTYITNMLMEENMDEKLDMYQEPSAVQATEKVLYDLIGQSYPPSSEGQPLDSSIHGSHTLNDSIPTVQYQNSNSFSSNSSGVGPDTSCITDFFNYQTNQTHIFSSDTSRSSFSSSNYYRNIPEGSENSVRDTNKAPELSSQALEDSVLSPLLPDISPASLPAWQFLKGVEEARKFLPSQEKLVIDLEATRVVLVPQPKEKSKENVRLMEMKSEHEETEYSISGLKGRKHLHHDEVDLEEGRSVKQSAVYTERAFRTEMFDKVLLCNDDNCGENGNIFKEVLEIREAVQNEVNKSFEDSHGKSSSNGKGRGKRQAKKDVVDLRTLLVQCAQMVASDDWRSSSELLKQIRKHSSPFGDGNQRLAHYFADGLEARLAGTGSQIYHSLVPKKRHASDILRAYQLYLAACPFKRVAHFVANRTILDLAEKKTRIHIVDFGIYYGFQWPCFIQRLGSRPGGPPKLRITGVDVPQPGFRPAEQIEETGKRLADYARSFNVPFEFQTIASNWQDVRIEYLHFQEDELLVVNCLHRNQNLMDETVLADSPRDIVLNTIREMNPDIFILGVLNGTYNAPFFVTRFREALFYFSALFDMLETNVPREDEQRALIEREIFGREALNVISCEGAERVERPESYKQWQARNIRAGFEQVSPCPDIVRRAKNKVRGSYHRDFIADVDSGWLVQGWKGRITNALSIWKPARTN